MVSKYSKSRRYTNFHLNLHKPLITFIQTGILFEFGYSCNNVGLTGGEGRNPLPFNIKTGIAYIYVCACVCMCVFCFSNQGFSLSISISRTTEIL